MQHSTTVTRRKQRAESFMKSAMIMTALLGCFYFGQAYSADAKQLTQAGVKRIKEGQAAQHQIEKLDDQVNKLESEYGQTLKVVESIRVYNQVLDGQVNQQRDEINQLEESIQNAAEIERQILPLIMRMIESLEMFVAADAPFLLAERHQRITDLKALMLRPDVSRAEQLNKVIEAYQEEIRYGYTIEAYPGQVAIKGKDQNVDFLRVGRVGLIYQSLDGQQQGAWNLEKRQWQSLDNQTYRRYLREGLKIARKQAAPDFLMVPVFEVTGLSEEVVK